MKTNRGTAGNRATVILVVVVALLICAAQAVNAATPVFVGTASIATLGANGNRNASNTSVTVQLISAGGFSSADIQSIRVYYERNDNGLYDCCGTGSTARMSSSDQASTSCRSGPRGSCGR